MPLLILRYELVPDTSFFGVNVGHHYLQVTLCQYRTTGLSSVW